MSTSTLARVSSRSSLLCKLHKRSLLSEVSPSQSSSKSRISSSRTHTSRISRLPVVLSSCLESMMPLHSAIASARLTSILSAESQSWGWIPQGISMPL
eukprot:TRINITY_DN9215_c0_g1_i1.p1 TRINITY_DN9215_c0_g1~~TRINITY_DN9215_c0_g1_i1.p1  ORF type:complete len:112 (+),score=3.91 TRINITY_DN9215_c0_g1_i1:43-336(+)